MLILKLFLLYNSTAACDFDLILLSETWATDSLKNSELCPNEYVVFRSDRVSGRGGGVLAAVRRSITCSVIYTSDGELLMSKVDLICLKLCLNNYSIYVIVLYLPPTSPLAAYELLYDKLEELQISTKDFVLAGDFNIPELTDLSSSKSMALHNFLSYHDALQINTIANNQGRLLDLVVISTKLNCSLSRSEFVLLPEDLYHPAIGFEVSLPVTQTVEQFVSKEKFYNYKRGDLLSLYMLMGEETWTDVLESNDITYALDKFYEILYGHINACVPFKERPKQKYPFWYSRNTIHYIKKKEHYYRQHRRCGSLFLRNEYYSYRKIVKKSINHDFENYIANIENGIKCEPKRMWSYTRCHEIR